MRAAGESGRGGDSGMGSGRLVLPCHLPTHPPTHTISRLSKHTILRRRQNEREGKRKRRRDDVEEPDPEAGLAEDGGNGREWEGKGFEMNVC